MRFPWQKPAARVFTVPFRTAPNGPSIEGFEEFVRGLATEIGNRDLSRDAMTVADKIAWMKTVQADYRRFDRFKAGDIVTPRKNTVPHGAGEPHIVLEVGPAAVSHPDDATTGDSDWGERLDMRVLHIGKGHMHPHWVESFFFEPYTPPA